ncbi:hypothetical protein D3C87_777280 [compost metagenome]
MPVRIGELDSVESDFPLHGLQGTSIGAIRDGGSFVDDGEDALGRPDGPLNASDAIGERLNGLDANADGGREGHQVGHGEAPLKHFPASDPEDARQRHHL